MARGRREKRTVLRSQQSASETGQAVVVGISIGALCVAKSCISFAVLAVALSVRPARARHMLEHLKRRTYSSDGMSGGLHCETEAIESAHVTLRSAHELRNRK